MPLQKIYRFAALAFAVGCLAIAAVSLQRGELLAGYTALGSPLLLLLPLLYRRPLGLPRYSGFDLRYLAFAFLTCPAGVGLTLYHILPWYDSLAHLLSGVFFAEMGVLLFVYSTGESPTKHGLCAGFALGFSAFIALGWELLEFLASLCFPIDPQNVAASGVADTMLDCLWCLLGSGLYLLWFWSRLHRPTLLKSLHTLWGNDHRFFKK